MKRGTLSILATFLLFLPSCKETPPDGISSNVEEIKQALKPYYRNISEPKCDEDLTGDKIDDDYIFADNTVYVAPSQFLTEQSANSRTWYDAHKDSYPFKGFLYRLND